DIAALIDADTLAVATDTALTLALPCLDLNQPAQIAAFIRDWLRRRTGAAGD
ncbi:molybdopterin-guanine dinucleotide biosynthesis protein B, partial [Dickeya dadantii]